MHNELEARDSGQQLTQDDPLDALIGMENVALYINLVFTTIFLYDFGWVTVALIVELHRQADFDINDHW